jgi:hypothetical protein
MLLVAIQGEAERTRELPWRRRRRRVLLLHSRQ